MRWIGNNEQNTSKKQRFSDLISRLRDHTGEFDNKESYDLWVETWIIPELQQLFPKWIIKKRDPKTGERISSKQAGESP